ncbi:MAG TPA: hypothetical protein VEQ59_22495, partial [Polyangiaceae bacterium]|nr:hypothetical protein [Polyangiaceae bacterium]
MLVLSTIAVVLWPRTYGTEASFAVDGAGPSLNAVALASRIEAALLERQELAGVAMELPPELRSPDPIGRLRAGIRVQSHGALSYGVEFRGSDQQSVQRIANRLADRAVALVPQLASPQDNAPAQALAARTRAVTEFLTAHPEMTLEAADIKPSGATDSGLEALRTEKRQIELRLTTGANDNPYSDPGQSPEILNRRLTELKLTIARREKALKEPHPNATPAVAPELVARWRALLADLGAAQAAASVPSVVPVVRAHVTARAPLPSSPLTPNRLVLSIVAALLSAAAAMAAYALPRFSEPPKRKAPSPKPVGGGTEPILAVRPGSESPAKRSDPPAAQGTEPPPAPRPSSEPPVPAAGSGPPPGPRPASEPPAKGSDAPPKRSDPPGPIAVQRTVVLSGPTTKSTNPPPEKMRQRSRTAPGGMEAPVLDPPPAATPGAHSPPAAPLFGSRPPPGAGSYSVSSSHPPAMDPRG